MNILLVSDTDVVSENIVQISGRRCHHLLKVLKVQVGQRLQVGMLNGLMGTAVVLKITAQVVELGLSLTEPAPLPTPVNIILAMPRPKVFKRVLQSLTTLGVKNIAIIHCQKVEKSYWQTPLLSADAIQEQLLLGLEQAKDTLLPRVTQYQRFKPFVEDILPEQLIGREFWLAHPGQGHTCQAVQSGKPVTYAIGPEGGFSDYEVSLLAKAGGQCCQLGARILRVETAVSILLSPWLR